MRNTLFILFALILLSNCTKSETFNLTKDLDGTWEVITDSTTKTFYTFSYFNNNERLLTISTLAPDQVFFPYEPANRYKIIDGNTIEVFNDYICILPVEGTEVHELPADYTYDIMYSKDKKTIVLNETQKGYTIRLNKK